VVLLQVDEPALPGVLSGQVRTASGFGTLRAVAGLAARSGLEIVLSAIEAAGGYPLVHCCAPGAPVRLLRAAGARALSLDLTLASPADDEALGEALEAGTALLAGLVPSTDAPLPDVGATVSPVRALWHRLGLDPADLGRTVAVTPTCGLAAASPPYARRALAQCRTAAGALRDDPEG
jgi:hypothetical protein